MRQSLNRDDAAEKNSGISPVNLHGGLGTTLTQRALLEHQWQAGLLAAARRTEESAKCNESQVSFLRHCPVSETGGLLTSRSELGSIIGRGAVIYPGMNGRGFLPANNIAKNRTGSRQTVEVVARRPRES